MRVLYYYSLDAFSRIIRLIMTEKMLDFKIQYELPWKPTEQFSSSIVYKMLPTLVDGNATCVSGVSAIMEYLEDAYQTPRVFGYTVAQRAETRQIAYWFISDFYTNVYEPITREKILNRFYSKTSVSPNPSIIRKALYNIPQFIDRVVYLLERRSWLAGREFSIADITVASFVSILDYLGVLKWNNYSELLLTWYVRIKSRKSFQPLLSDIMSSIPPSRSYAKLDY